MFYDCFDSLLCISTFKSAAILTFTNKDIFVSFNFIILFLMDVIFELVSGV